MKKEQAFQQMILEQTKVYMPKKKNPEKKRNESSTYLSYYTKFKRNE